MREWVAGRSTGQFLLLTVSLALVCTAAGWVAVDEWHINGQACSTAREFADSVASNGTRLAALDGVLAKYDLTQSAIPDTGAWKDGPNRLERRIIGLRMSGLTAPQMERWLAGDMLLAERAGGGVGSADTAQLGLIHAFERSMPYDRYLHAIFQLTADYWHDMNVLAPLAERWQERCAVFRSRMAAATPIFSLAAAVLFLALSLRLRKPGIPRV